MKYYFVLYEIVIYICRMTLITIKEFAELHDVDESAIRHAVKSGKLIPKLRFGKQVLSRSLKYEPVRGRGRKPAKRKPNTKNK